LDVERQALAFVQLGFCTRLAKLAQTRSRNRFFAAFALLPPFLAFTSNLKHVTSNISGLLRYRFSSENFPLLSTREWRAQVSDDSS
jgi:hypothetical protein